MTTLIGAMGRDDYWGRFGRRRTSRRRFLAGSGVAVAGWGAVLAGCGGASPSPPPVATGSSVATPTPTLSPTRMGVAPSAQTPTPTATPAPDPNAHGRGGTLRLWKATEDAGLDPGIYHTNNRDVIYSTLTQPLTYQPSKNLFAMDGMVGYEQVDPVTLVWSIRPGMQFHNGDSVDAEAVAFSFGRLSKLQRALEYTHVRSDGYNFVDSFEPTDELTLTEHWSRPNADALIHRSQHYYSFLNPRLVKEQGTIVGTYTAPDGITEDVYSVQNLPFGSGSGPYVLTKRDETGTRVERWPDYHRHIPADDGFVENGPYIDAWEAHVMPDWASRKAAFLGGDLDVYGLFRTEEELAQLKDSDHINVVETQNGGLSHLGMDGLKFHDKRARQALQKAIDYEGSIKAVWPRGGQHAGPISNLLPHLQPLTQQDLQQWQRHDPGEARALWEAADFEVSIDSIKILVSGGSAAQWQMSEFVAQSLGEALGLSTELWHTDSYCRTWSGCPRPSGEPDDLEAIVYGTGEAGGTTGIPYDSQLVHYDPRWHGPAFNHSHLIESSPPEIEADALTLTGMLEAQEQEIDFDTRVGLLTDIQRWILDNAWCVLQLPVSAVQYYGVSARLRDFAPDDWLNGYALRRESMWLASS